MSLKNLNRKKIVFIVGILFVLFVILSIASIVYTERPEFCLSCHIMKPYYDSWKGSPHKEVNCTECHYEPGLKAHAIGKINGLVQVVQYVTKRYSTKPSAEVSDLSCLKGGCHEKEKLKTKKVIFKKGIEFEHKKHFGKLKDDMQLKCTSCHTQVTSDEHIIVDKNTCFTCHFGPQSGVSEDVSPLTGEQCLKCHSGMKKSGEHKEYIEEGLACGECHSGIKSDGGRVRRQICSFCHADREDIEKIDDKKLMHKTHIYENKVDCTACHDLIRHGEGD